MNPTQASLSEPPNTPAGAGAGCVTPSTLLLLFIIRLFIAWAEGAAASIRQRAETADINDLLREFGTTDTALILERITHGLQRLRALEAKVLRHATGLGSDPLLTSTAAAASARSPSAPQPPSRTPQHVHLLPTARTLGRRTAVPNRATGPPPPPTQPEPTVTGPVHPLTPRGMGGPVVPIPQPPLILPQMHADARRWTERAQSSWATRWISRRGLPKSSNRHKCSLLCDRKPCLTHFMRQAFS
jgi:hypothetical protein